jgi:hypothetical protein
MLSDRKQVFDHISPFVVGRQILDHATLKPKLSNLIEIGFYPNSYVKDEYRILDFILALNPLRNVVTSNYTLSFLKFEDELEVIDDPDANMNFHFDLDIDFRASVLENRYFTMMDCLLELSSFAYVLGISAGLLASNRVYNSYSLSVSQHLRNQ